MNLMILARGAFNGILLFIFVTATIFHANYKEGRLQYLYTVAFVVIMLALSKAGGVRWQ